MVSSSFPKTKWNFSPVWLTFSWRKHLSYWNQSVDLHFKSIDWFQYDRDLRHDSVKSIRKMLAEC